MATFIYILFLHLIGDFAAQTRWMAENKSKEHTPLVIHVLCYGLVLSLGLGWLVHLPQLLGFIGLNAFAHLITDSITSRMTSYFWSRSWTYMFFLTIGFDQFLHTATLAISANWLLGVP